MTKLIDMAALVYILNELGFWIILGLMVLFGIAWIIHGLLSDYISNKKYERARKKEERRDETSGKNF